MPRITDPALLQHLGLPPSQSPLNNGLKPPEGYHRTSPIAVAPDAGGPQDIGTIDAIERTKTGIQTGAERQLIGARTAAEIQAAKIKSQIELQKEAAAREAERQFKLQQTPQQRSMASLTNDEVLQAIDQARQLVNDGHSTGLASQVFGRVGGTNAVDLASTLDTIKGNLTLDNLQKLKAASTTGASGMGSLTEKEGELLASTVASLNQKQSAEKMLDSLAKIEGHYRRWNALNNGEDPTTPEVAKRYGIVASAPPAASGNDGGPTDPFSGPSQQHMAPSHGTESVPDPTLAGVNNHLRALIQGGASTEQVNAYLEQVKPGLSQNVQGVDGWVKYHAQRPKAAINVNVETKDVPLSNFRGALNTAAQSPVGAFFMGAGDTASLGTMDNLSSNPALSRAALQYSSQAHPYATTAGQFTGAAVDSALLAGAGNALNLGRGALPAADMAFGGGYGAGSTDEGNRLVGGLEGSVVGAAGGKLGRMAFRGLGNGLRGVQNPDAQLLRAGGVKNMTIGQIVADSGGLGRYLKGREDRLAGFSGIGDKIKAQQTNSLRSFNQGTFDQGLSDVGPIAPGIAETGVENARAASSAGYGKALGGVNVAPDAQFTTDYANATAKGANIARTGPEFQTYVDNHFEPFVNQPNISGAQIQDMLQGVQKANFGNDSMGDLAKGAVHDIGGAVSDMVDRQAPGVMPDLAKANRAYRNTNILADAVNRAVNTDGLFTPAQLGQSARANAVRFNGKIGAATTDRPFYEWQRAGQNILPSKVPDSGTAGREAADGGFTATMKQLARNTANAPLYSDTLNPLLNALLLDRPDAVLNFGKLVGKRLPRPGGMFGNAAALKYVYGQ
jgi:hypothetical protein